MQEGRRMITAYQKAKQDAMGELYTARDALMRVHNSSLLTPGRPHIWEKGHPPVLPGLIDHIDALYQQLNPNHPPA